MKRDIMIYIAVFIVLVIAVVAYLYYSSIGSSGYTQLDEKPVNATVLAQLKTVAMNNSLANAVGGGIAGSSTNIPKIINGSALLINNKYGVLYIGADYCPYCAIMRWGLVLALMRFGNFTALRYMSSTPNDVYPNSATFTFYNTSYTSSVIGFASVETQDRNGTNLQKMNASQGVTFSRYGTGAIPFIDFGNKSIQIGAMITPQVIQGDSWNQIIAALNNPNSPIAQGIIGSANIFTAYICKSNPSLNPNVCNQQYIKNIQAIGR